MPPAAREAFGLLRLLAGTGRKRRMPEQSHRLAHLGGRGQLLEIAADDHVDHIVFALEVELHPRIGEEVGTNEMSRADRFRPIANNGHYIRMVGILAVYLLAFNFGDIELPVTEVGGDVGAQALGLSRVEDIDVYIWLVG